MNRRKFLAAAGLAAVLPLTFNADPRPARQPSKRLCEAFAELLFLFDGSSEEAKLEIIRTFETATFDEGAADDLAAVERFFKYTAECLKKRMLN